MTFVCAECGNNISSVTCRVCTDLPVGELPAEVWKRSAPTHSPSTLQKRQQQKRDNIAQRRIITNRSTSHGSPTRSGSNNSNSYLYGHPLSTTTLPPLQTPPNRNNHGAETMSLPAVVFKKRSPFDTMKWPENGHLPPLTNRETEDRSSSETENTVHCIQFQGDVWEAVLPEKEKELHEALAQDISNTLRFPCVASVSLTDTYGGFLAYCSVQHPKNFSGEYIDRCLNNYHYPATRKIYQSLRHPYASCPPALECNYYEKDAYTQGNQQVMSNSNDKKPVTSVFPETLPQGFNKGHLSLTTSASTAEFYKSPIKTNPSTESLNASPYRHQEYYGVRTSHQQPHTPINSGTETGLRETTGKLDSLEMRSKNTLTRSDLPDHAAPDQTDKETPKTILDYSNHNVPDTTSTLHDKTSRATTVTTSPHQNPPYYEVSNHSYDKSQPSEKILKQQQVTLQRETIGSSPIQGSARPDDERSLGPWSISSPPPREAMMMDNRSVSSYPVQARLRTDDERSLAQESIASLPPREAVMVDNRSISSYPVQTHYRTDYERSPSQGSMASVPFCEMTMVGDQRLVSDPVKHKGSFGNEECSCDVCDGPAVNNIEADHVFLFSTVPNVGSKCLEDGDSMDDWSLPRRVTAAKGTTSPVRVRDNSGDDDRMDDRSLPRSVMSAKGTTSPVRVRDNSGDDDDRMDDRSLPRSVMSAKGTTSRVRVRDNDDSMDDWSLPRRIVTEAWSDRGILSTEGVSGKDILAPFPMSEIREKDNDDALLDFIETDMGASNVSRPCIYASSSKSPHESRVNNSFSSRRTSSSESIFTDSNHSKVSERDNPVSSVGGNNWIVSTVPLVSDDSDPAERWLNVSAGQQLDDSARIISRVAARSRTGTDCRQLLPEDNTDLLRDRGQSIPEKSPNELMLSFVESENHAQATSASSRVSTSGIDNEMASSTGPIAAQPIEVVEREREQENTEQLPSTVGLHHADRSASSDVPEESYCIEVCEMSVSNSSDTSGTDIWVSGGRLASLSQLLRDLEEADRLLRQPVKLLQNLRSQRTQCGWLER